LGPPGDKNDTLFRQKQRTDDASHQTARSVAQIGDGGATFSEKRRFRARNRHISGGPMIIKAMRLVARSGVFRVAARQISGEFLTERADRRRVSA
jgi:hypothetical protein